MILLNNYQYSSTSVVQPPLYPSQSGLTSYMACYDRDGQFHTHIFDDHSHHLNIKQDGNIIMHHKFADVMLSSGEGKNIS